MNSKYVKSKLLSETENRELDVLSSLAYAAPLSERKYDRYVELCRKAHRKPHAERV